jgi:hypothetical protein
VADRAPIDAQARAGAPLRRCLALLPWQTRFALAAMLAGGIAIGWVLRGAVALDDAGSAAAALPHDAAPAPPSLRPEPPSDRDLDRPRGAIP